MVQHNNKIRSLTNIDETTVFKGRLSYVYIIRFGGIWGGRGGGVEKEAQSDLSQYYLCYCISSTRDVSKTGEQMEVNFTYLD